MSFLRNPDNRRVMAAKAWVAEALCSPAMGRAVTRATGGVVRVKGLRIDTRSAALDPGVPAALLFRIYEGAELRLLEAHVEPSACVVELGTSLGVVGSAAARALEPGARYVGVEANPALVGLALRNVRANAPQVAADVLHGAIDYSRAAGDTTAFRSEGSHLASALGEGPGFVAPVVRLGDLLREQGVGDYTLLMDIEGAEAGLLERDSAALEWCRQMIVEFHDTTFAGRAWSRAELAARVDDLGFRRVAEYGSVVVYAR
ncbi:FkbM family methyltransferase [Nocardioides jejuensis]|uniref:FkbM family methyltransferase n=1 Tax=Nocardioides jejuensis TaxID=2502782 RepID=A0A4R1CGY6_9ACTN|nr:FkbM family methyltransferase [Nocardioides jejuensis]TCJ30221.1 FkbM family methyltransferase [Nocardioides jejuensis]